MLAAEHVVARALEDARNDATDDVDVIGHLLSCNFEIAKKALHDTMHFITETKRTCAESAAVQINDLRTRCTNLHEENDRLRMLLKTCLLYTSPSPRDRTRSRMPSSA